MSKEIIVFDSQRLTGIQHCAYRYDLVFNQNVAPVLKEEPLESGDLMHKMLEAYYRGANARHEVGKEIMIKACTTIGERHAAELSLQTEEVDDCIRVFKEYVEFYWNEPHQTLAVEKVASRVIYEDEQVQFIYEGKMDWVVSLGNVSVMPADHKRYSRRWEILPLNNQFMGYCWLLNVSNMMVNRIGMQRTVKPEDKFLRPIMSYPVGVIDAWVKNTIWWMWFYTECVRKGEWPQNFTSCDKYLKANGDMGCQFKGVCIQSPEHRLHTIKNLFVERDPWDIGGKNL